MLVTIRAQAVHRNEGGTFDLYLEGEPLSKEQTEVLERLFPNLRGAAEELLGKELLLASIAKPSERLPEPPPEAAGPEPEAKNRSKY